MTVFPERVWEQCENGLWSSRIANEDDRIRRAKVFEMLTSPEAKRRKFLADQMRKEVVIK